MVAKASPGIILLTILLSVLLFTLYCPFPMINSDSVHGFEAMNGYFWTGRFNTLISFDQETQRLQERFLTWWSPGQYLAPLLLMKLFQLKIGVAVTLVNAIGTWIGVSGYYFVFRNSGFDRRTIWISILLILFSSSVLQRYYLYDGGESLNIMLFPWILIIGRKFISPYGKWILPGLVLFVSFVCKLQMLIVVPVLIFFLIASNRKELGYFFIWKKQFRWQEFRESVQIYFPYLLSVGLVSLFIYFAFISRGATPASPIKQISLNPVNLFFPLASPVTSIYVFDSVNAYLRSRPLLQDFFLLVATVLVIAVFIDSMKGREAVDKQRKYKVTVLMLYIVTALVFIFLYAGGSSVDFNTRHFKLTSFLFYPILVDWTFRKLNKRLVLGLFSLCFCYALGNHIRLQKKWHMGSSVTNSRFLLSRTDMPLLEKSRLDSLIERNTVVISPYDNLYAIDNPAILPVRGDQKDSLVISRSGYPVVVLR